MKSLIKKLLPSFLLDWYHFGLSFLGAVIYRFPSKKLKVIGVTGTNGKSTTVYLISQILKEAGFKAASLSSIEFQVNDRRWPNKSRMTMPGRFIIKKFLRQAVDASCSHAVLEVASEGIKQYRHKFIDFEVAVFTNLTPEHIEAHKGFENYKEAKGKLFEAAKNIHIINLDDENAEYFLAFPAKEKITYGLNRGEVNAQNTKLRLKLPGEFNVSNALAAVATGLSQGISLETCRQAVERAESIPGRMEEVASSPFKVIVDYAFTPNALEKVYQTLISSLNRQSSNKLICVLGAAGGGRDKWKRPVLGKIASQYCAETIVTNEDPYDEDPQEIIDQVARGAGEKAQKVQDRREAIRQAFSLARPGDAVIITGKGCESSICGAGGKRVSWDDRQVAREELARLKK